VGEAGDRTAFQQMVLYLQERELLQRDRAFDDSPVHAQSGAVLDAALGDVW
jgi:hypothetical protein